MACCQTRNRAIDQRCSGHRAGNPQFAYRRHRATGCSLIRGAGRFRSRCKFEPSASNVRCRTEHSRKGAYSPPLRLEASNAFLISAHLMKLLLGVGFASLASADEHRDDHRDHRDDHHDDQEHH